MTQLDLGALEPWLGRTETHEDVLTQGLIDRFRATFGRHLWDGGKNAVPLGLHWCLALAAAPADDLSVDGHVKKGGFLPPVPLPSRMWSGGELTHLAPLRVGETVARHSTIRDITPKHGRSGLLVFVTLDHVYTSGAEVCISEQQTIVYRDIAASRPGVSAAEVQGPNTLRSCLTMDPVLLFRYSALTFNAHRIHYDHVYATETEAYRGLVVHGPLQATLLLNVAAKAMDDTPKRFSFRGLAPMTLPCELELHLQGSGLDGTAWCQDREGRRSFMSEYFGT